MGREPLLPTRSDYHQLDREKKRVDWFAIAKVQFILMAKTQTYSSGGAGSVSERPGSSSEAGRFEAAFFRGAFCCNGGAAVFFIAGVALFGGNLGPALFRCGLRSLFLSYCLLHAGSLSASLCWCLGPRPGIATGADLIADGRNRGFGYRRTLHFGHLIESREEGGYHGLGATGDAGCSGIFSHVDRPFPGRDRPACRWNAAL